MSTRIASDGSEIGEFLRSAMITKTYADLVLCCPGGRRFSAHRLVLSAASPYLRRVLLSHDADTDFSQPITLILADVASTELTAILEFVYTGSTRISGERLDAFLGAAETLEIKIPPLPRPLCSSLNLKKEDLDVGRVPERRNKFIVANRVSASPWCQITRPHHHPRIQPIILKTISQSSTAIHQTAGSASPRQTEEDVSPIESSISHCADERKNEEYKGEEDKDQYKCKICDKVLVNRASLQVHARVHSGEKPFRCKDCGKEFSQLRNFKYHRSVHEGTGEFSGKCLECGKSFNDRGYLGSHMKIHRNRKEYACQECGRSFNQRVAYNMHVRIHSGVKPHRCEQCGKGFSRKMLLKQHLRTHTGERPYQCQICQKAFADRSNMTLHTRLHSGLKPYQCEICGKAFTKKHHLKTHLNYHYGVKPYACPNCSLTFSQSSNMRTHLKKCRGNSSR